MHVRATIFELASYDHPSLVRLRHGTGIDQITDKHGQKDKY